MTTVLLCQIKLTKNFGFCRIFVTVSRGCFLTQRLKLVTLDSKRSHVLAIPNQVTTGVEQIALVSVFGYILMNNDDDNRINKTSIFYFLTFGFAGLRTFTAYQYGWAYLFPTGLIEPLLEVAAEPREAYLYQDDLLVTGILRKKIGANVVHWDTLYRIEARKGCTPIDIDLSTLSDQPMTKNNSGHEDRNTHVKNNSHNTDVPVDHQGGYAVRLPTLRVVS